MGKRARARGVTESMLRAARRAQNERDPRAHEVAQAVYLEVLNWRENQGPDFMAPVGVAAGMAAEQLAPALGVSPEECAAYLAERFWAEVLMATPERYRAWAESKADPVEPTGALVE